MKKKNAFTLITVFLVVVINLCIAEVIIRIYNFTSEKERWIWTPDPFLGFIHSSNNRFTWEDKFRGEFSVKHQTNEFGLMGRPISKEKPENTFRILMLGDSFTEAIQVEKTHSYAEVLESKLNDYFKDRGLHIEVLNGGVSGYSPIMKYLLYKRNLSKLSPDLVIQQLWTNDLFDDNKVGAMSLLDKDGLPIKINRFQYKKYLDRRVYKKEELANLERWYPLFNFFKYHIRSVEYFYGRWVKAHKNDKLNKAMRADPHYEEHYQFYMIDDLNPLAKNEEFIKKTMEQTTRYILALKNLVEQNKAKHMLFYIPMEAQLGLDHPSNHSKMYFGEDSKKGRRINDYLDEMTKQYKINYIDFMPNFIEHKNDGLYIDWEGHLNEEGQHFVAEALIPRIVELINNSLK